MFRTSPVTTTTATTTDGNGSGHVTLLAGAPTGSTRSRTNSRHVPSNDLPSTVQYDGDMGVPHDVLVDDLFDANADQINLLLADGIDFNVVDGTVAAAVDPNSPWILFKGRSTDTWFYAPRWGRLKLRPDGSPAFTLTAKVKNNPDGSRDWVGGTLAFLFELAQELPSAQEIREWHDRIRSLHGIVPRGSGFNFQPLQLTKGKLNVFGMDSKVLPGQQLKDIEIGASSSIAFAFDLTGEAAEQYYKQIQSGANIPPQIAIVCDFRYRYVLPTCRIRVSGYKKKTYDYFSENVRARASYWGLVGGSYDRSTTRVEVKNSGGLNVDIVGTPPAGFDLTKLMDALFDRFLMKEAGAWIEPDATPVQAPAPRGFFGGASYSMKRVNISDTDQWSGTFDFAEIGEEVHKLSFNFESAFSSLDASRHTVLIEDDRKLELKICIGKSTLVDQIAAVATYTRSGQPVRVTVPDTGAEGGIVTGIMQYSAGLEPKPTSAQIEAAIMFPSPHRSYTMTKTVPVSDSGAVLALFPENFIQRTELLFIFNYTDSSSLAICQWKWTPPPGSTSLPIQRAVRVAVDQNAINFPSTQIEFPLPPSDAGGVLKVKVQGLRGDWAGQQTSEFTLNLGDQSIAVDWGGPLVVGS